MTHPRAGLPATPDDLTDISALLDAYFTVAPDVKNPDQKVVFGTSGHRGSSFNGSFNEQHIIAITQAIIDYRRQENIQGPLFLGRDTHALSEPAHRTALEVLIANEITVFYDKDDSYVPTPALSHAIVNYNSQLPGGVAGNSVGRADGIVITPSHNPPQDGGFKYNLPTGGPAGSDATSWIAHQANEYLAQQCAGIQRVSLPENLRSISDYAKPYDYLHNYVSELHTIIDMDAIAESKIHIGADPMGGASVRYWSRIGEHYGLNLDVVNDKVDPQFSFMTLDSDGAIRMDCSSPWAMQSLVANRDKYDIATGNDADSDRHGIVTPDSGLMNPNHYLAVAIEYLFSTRTEWSSRAAVGKTVVSSSMIDRVARGLGRELYEVPVGFKWFVPGLLSGNLGFGGEESAGASFLTHQGKPWSTDKDGIIADLLASEIIVKKGKTPSRIYAEMVEHYGQPHYARTDAPADRVQRQRLGALAESDVTGTRLAGEKIESIMTQAPGNGAALGGVKVATENAWFAARPSGTEDKYKIYAESFLGEEHLRKVQDEAQTLVQAALEN